MPLPGPASTSPDSAVDPEPQHGEHVSGWAAIEHHLYKHDGGEMKYYAEDIDTLLVFAGLFSAFLTAFVVQTYPMLTEADSSTTNQLLALSVSAQLRMTGIIPPPTVNATLVSLLDAPAFAPTAAARVINIFFFLSLVLSLSSALFGILAKQWIREYLRWNSPLALPRENILVRQARVEEWEAWNVGATISSIPALLESAMVLFLIGIVVLLWTLDSLVAMTITIFASLFLFTAFAFTIMPILQTRCPYKSPTAWACIVMSHASKRLYMAFLRLLRRIRGKTMYGLYPQTAPTTWRELDLRSCREPRVKVNGRELTRLLFTVAVGRHLPPGSGFQPGQSKEAEDVLMNVIETSLLLQALTWVKQSSQDPRIDAYITQCAESIHFNHPPLLAKMTVASNLVANRCILLSLKRQSPRLPYLDPLYGFLYPVDCYGESSSELDIAVTAYRPHASLLSQMLSTLPEGATVRREDRFTAQILGRITLADLQYSLKQTEEARNVTVIQELCAILDDLQVWDRDGWYQEALCLTINSTNGISYWGESGSNLRYRTFLKALRGGRLRATSDHRLIYTAEETTREDLESLLLDYFIDDPALANGTYLLMFLVTFTSLLEDVMQRYEDADLDPILLDKASWFAAYALSCQSCDIHHQALYLLSRVLNNCVYDRVVIEITRTRSPKFRQLIHAAERNFSGEFTDNDSFRVGALHDLLELTHKDLPACEEATCRWISHQCHDELPGTCSIFGNLANRCRAARDLLARQEPVNRAGWGSSYTAAPQSAGETLPHRAQVVSTPAPTSRTWMREAWHRVARARPRSEHTRNSSSTASEAGLESRTTTSDDIPLHVIGDAPAEGMEGHEGGETV